MLHRNLNSFMFTKCEPVQLKIEICIIFVLFQDVYITVGRSPMACENTYHLLPLGRLIYNCA